MRNLTLAAAFFAATLPVAAFAADWVFVAENLSGNTFYIDRETIRTMPNGYKRAWVRSYFSKPTDYGDTGYRSLSEFDCREGRYREMQITWFKGEDVSTQENTPREWRYAAPETAGESSLNFVCFGKLSE